VSRAAAQVDRGAWPYRMKDLCDRTGLARQVIHFYIQQGLLPEGHKTGRNMAYYGESHLARLTLIRQLQNERFLPLKAIRAVLDGQEDAFTPEQQRLLSDVKQRLAPVLGVTPGQGPEMIELKPLLLRTGVSRDDAREMEELGLVTTTKRKGKRRIASEQAWILEVWGEMRRLGFTRALGFTPKDMLVFADAISDLFQRERDMLRDRLSHLPPDDVAPMVERSIPIINTFLARYHESLIRSFFASVDA
jgi:DNA-binding transcriptional MerR regulator